MIKRPTNEAIKEFFRLAILAIPPIALYALGYIDADTVILVTGALRAAEKFLHELNKHIEGRYPELPF